MNFRIGNYGDTLVNVRSKVHICFDENDAHVTKMNMIDRILKWHEISKYGQVDLRMNY